MSWLSDILIKIGGDTSQYHKAMWDIELSTKKTTQAIASMWKIAAGGITLISAGAFVNFIKNNVAAADAIAKTADRVGVSTNALQEYRYAADLAGVGTEQLDNSLEKFTKNLGEARQGTGSLTTFLKKYDESLLTNIKNSKSSDEALNLVLTTMGNMSSEADKAALAAAAFGKSGIDMTGMVKGGAEGLNKMRQEARDLGIVIEERLIRSAETANDRFDTLAWVVKNKTMSALLELSPEIVGITEALIKMTQWAFKGAENIGIVFGIGEKNRLRYELTLATEELNKREELQRKFKEGNAWDRFWSGGDQSKGIEFYNKRRIEITKKLRELESPMSMPGSGPAVPWEPSAPENKKENKKGVDSELREYFDFLDEREKRFSEIYDENIKREQQMAKTRIEIATDVTDKINTLTMDELTYKKWALDEEVRALMEKAGDDIELQDKITKYHQAATKKLTTGAKAFGEEMQEAFTGWATSYSSTLNDMLWESKFTFGDIATEFGKMITQMMIQKGMMYAAENSGSWFKMIGSTIGSYFGGGAKAEMGEIFGGDGIAAYENSIVNRPTIFPFARGIGLIGEAGYEGVLPLTRTSSGNLGVEAKMGGGGNTIIIDQRQSQFLDQETMARSVNAAVKSGVENYAVEVVKNDYETDGWTRQTLGR